MLLVLLLPLFASLLLPFFKGNSARWVALLFSIITFILTIFLMPTFNSTGVLNGVVDYAWMPSMGINFKLGYDGISLLMLLLTNLLVPIIIGSSWEKDFSKPSLFYALVMLMQFALIGVFTAMDGFLFYIFWEIALIPIYFICALWGGQDRIKITLKFFIYTFVGSLFMLVSLIYLYLQTPAPHSFDITALYNVKLTPQTANYVLLGLFLAFAIKIPIFPFHTWQPDTYSESPTSGTMLLSGIMLKMGLYGLIRWMLPLAPEGLAHTTPIMITLAVIGIVYASIIAIKQQDIKRLVAYSSIAHVGLIAAGIFAANQTGWQGGLIQMLNHGINVVGLFLACDIIISRTGTRQLSQLGGIAKSAPRFAVLFMIIMLGSVAVPLTNGFVGEFLLLNGVYQYNFWLCVIAGLTIIFCAVYMLRIYQFTMFGDSNTLTSNFKDVDISTICVEIVLLIFLPPESSYIKIAND
ncbi:MAG: NADH-quinone oxidoreductase subunit M [Saprospiraceae bacterium]|nr:NADH-quinone oxidoreductase subunit M [Saprospiraceae bacterium]